MKGILFEGSGSFRVIEKEIPRIREEDEVLVRVKKASICGSDLQVLNVPPGQYAKPGIILGHEFSGEVEETGSNVKMFQRGDRVIVDPIVKCGICDMCRKGFGNLCRNPRIIGQTTDGGFAQFVVVPEKCLFYVPEEVSDRLASVAEPLACVMNGILKLRPMAQEYAVIYGAGAIGLMFLAVLRYYGLRHVAVCEMNEERKNMALRMGAEFAADTEGMDGFLREKWGRSPDVVIDAVGAGVITEHAIQILQPAGRLLIFGQNSTQYSRIRPSDINTKELTVIGTISTRNSFPAAIELLRDPKLRVEELITDEFSLDDFSCAIDQMRMKHGAKILIDPWR